MLDDMLNTPPDADYEPVGFDQFGYPVDPTGTQPPVVINVKNLNVTQNLGGAPIYNYTMPYSTKSRMLTLLLAIFLGFFGAQTASTPGGSAAAFCTSSPLACSGSAGCGTSSRSPSAASPTATGSTSLTGNGARNGAAMADYTLEDPIWGGFRTYHDDGTVSRTLEDPVWGGYRTWHPDGSTSRTLEDPVWGGYRTWHSDGSTSRTLEDPVLTGYRTWNSDGSTDRTLEVPGLGGYATYHHGGDDDDDCRDPDDRDDDDDDCRDPDDRDDDDDDFEIDISYYR